MSLGGVSEASRATPEIQMIANKVRPQLEAKTNKKYEKFEAVEYKTQVVAGENIFIKMDVGHGCFIHIKVFNGPTGKDNYELHGYQTDKTMDEELTYF
ncbi:stefin-1 [Mus musculus]|uniref:Stefin-1 n=1 Tax=Mus musculus TaxID=10090 RepID=CYT1_MOUSE|nr:stefin-1 [Mus musculus]P35175.1 RecName: Full=Stefin-1 [Mus musculus]|eukprot:NP_001076012.1 stefin-1 [Mus musculus]